MSGSEHAGTNALTPDERARVLAALPWYLNGTLAEAEASWVDRCARQSAECRQLIAEERQLARCMSAGIPAVPADIGAARLRRRMAAEAAERATKKARRPAAPPPSGFWRRIASRPGAMQIALGAIFALQSLAIVYYRDAAQTRYAEIRSPASAAPPLLRVRFAAAARMADIQQSLLATSTDVVAGPDLVGEVWLRSRLYSAQELKQRLLASQLVNSAVEDHRVLP
jgi:hypothetical protein